MHSNRHETQAHNSHHVGVPIMGFSLYDTDTDGFSLKAVPLTAINVMGNRENSTLMDSIRCYRVNIKCVTESPLEEEMVEVTSQAGWREKESIAN